MTNELKQTIILLYQQGYTIKQIAEKYNYSFSAIYHLLRMEQQITLKGAKKPK